MKGLQCSQEYLVLEDFCKRIKIALSHDCREMYKKTLDMMIQYPDAPQPQNLLGIIAELNGDKVLAMKHYRAAWSLAPNYRPSRENIDRMVETSVACPIFFNDEDVNEFEKKQKGKLR